MNVQDLSQPLQQHIIKTVAQPKMLCPSAHPVVAICIDSQCQADQALICHEQNCRSCVSKHEHCGQTVKLWYFTNMLKRESDYSKLFFEKIWKVEENFLKKTMEFTRARIQKHHLGIFTTQQKKVIQQLFMEGQKAYIDSQTVIQVLNKIKEAKHQDKEIQQKIIKKFQEQFSHIQSRFQHCLSEVFDEYFSQKNQKDNCQKAKQSQSKEDSDIKKTQIKADSELFIIDETEYQSTKKKQMKSKMQSKQLLKSKSMSSAFMTPVGNKNNPEKVLQEIDINKKNLFPALNQSLILTDSHIISKFQIQSQEFISKILNKPTKLRLLFRASDYNFLASEFHKKCDFMTNTFTIIKTQFGNILGGYTPLAWSSVLGFIRDPKANSILFSIDTKQTMALKNLDRAIFNHPQYGPCFSQDIVIGNNCHTAQQSSSSFPRNYYIDDPQQRKKFIHTSFTGTFEGKKFKVIDYEVYYVSWK